MRSDTETPQGKTFYHGTRAVLKPGDLVSPHDAGNDGAGDMESGFVCLTPNLDAAIWEAELAAGDGPGRVYVVESTGDVADAATLPGWKARPHPSMAWRSRAPLRVIGEVTSWSHYHGTRADLGPGDLIKPGQAPNFGNRDRSTRYVYFTRTLDAAIWGAELAAGEGPGRIYVVEPTGPIEDDPNLTDQKFQGNPSKSFRARDPLRVTGEITGWPGHPSAVIAAMREGLERLEQQGVEPMDE